MKKVYDITPYAEYREKEDLIDKLNVKTSRPFIPVITAEQNSMIEENRTYITEEIVRENEERKKPFESHYDPLTGEGSFSVPRAMVRFAEVGTMYIPKEMAALPEIAQLIRYRSLKKALMAKTGKEPTESEISQLLEEFLRIRLKYDFEYWAITCVKIKPKQGGANIPFLLNYAQRTMLKIVESQRLDDMPIRIIVLKSRQMGGSTFIQMYMAWIQLNHMTAWNSAIIAQVKDTAATIKGMYARVLDDYPEHIMGKLKFDPYQRMLSCYQIKQRNCLVTISSSETPDAVRGQDIAMAHLSEVAFWKDSQEKKATDLIRSITSTIPLVPMSVIAIESTANGVGDYFHGEWVRAERGESDKTPIFMPWYMDTKNVLPMKANAIEQFLASMTPYEWFLWDKGATLENIKWYRAKRKEFSLAEDMQAEYPTTALEAFKNSGRRVFPQEHVDFQRKHYVKEPKFVGEVFSNTKETKGDRCLDGLMFVPVGNGELKVWELPARKDDEGDAFANRYVVAVDAGGRTIRSDWSVIVVIDRANLLDGGSPEIVAQWRGHCDLDLLAWKAAQIACFYDNALLVIESNTFEKNQTEGFHGQFILETIASSYGNLYFRTDATKIREGLPARYGFHTNEATKTQIIDNLIGMLRCTVIGGGTGLIERDAGACDEYDTYEVTAQGKLSAVAGRHDDMLMARAIGLYVAVSSNNQVYKVVTEYKTHKRAIVSEASF